MCIGVLYDVTQEAGVGLGRVDGPRKGDLSRCRWLRLWVVCVLIVRDFDAGVCGRFFGWANESGFVVWGIWSGRAFVGLDVRCGLRLRSVSVDGSDVMTTSYVNLVPHRLARGVLGFSSYRDGRINRRSVPTSPPLCFSLIGAPRPPAYY